MRARKPEPRDVRLSEITELPSEPLKRMSYPKRALSLVGGLVALSLIAASAVSAPALALGSTVNIAVDAWDNMPVDLPSEQPVPTYTVLLDKNGNQFAQFFSENRVQVTLDEVSPLVVEALVATEDAGFWDHGGVDVKGIARATVKNFTSDSTQGASTITMQLVENLRIAHAEGPEDVADAKAGSLLGKLQEARYAISLEEQYTKEEILTLYLNTVYLGSGAYGIGTAAKRYFNVSAADLTVEQAATIIGLLKSPIIYDPLVHPESSKNRRDTVLSRMETVGMITEAEFDAAYAAPLVTTPTTFANGCTDSSYPYYCSYVRETLLSNPVFGETQEERDANLYLGGMVIQTALDPDAMAKVDVSIQEAMSNDNRVAAGVAVVQPGTGYVSAVGQNRTWGQGEGQTEILYANSRFQPGSSFKPVTLATAFEQGISPSVTFNAPSRLTPGNGLASPEGGFRNSPDRDFGVIDAREATKNSVNTWYVQLISRVGVLATADMADRLGIHGLPRSGDRSITGAEASLTLGAYEASPIEMATAYATFASGGIQCEPTPIIAITDAITGEPREAPDPNCHRALMPGVAATVADVLQQPLTEGGTAENAGIGRPAAGKTGTTNSFAATWFVGFTPQYATAVWIGDPRGGQGNPLTNVRAYGKSIPYVYGADIAAPIWQRVMTSIHDGLPVQGLPPVNAASLAVKGTSLPDTRGMTMDAAATSLIDAGATVTVNAATGTNSASTPGIVESQNVVGSSVTLTLTPGSDPSVLGKSIIRTDETTLTIEGDS